MTGAIAGSIIAAIIRTHMIMVMTMTPADQFVGSIIPIIGSIAIASPMAPSPIAMAPSPAIVAPPIAPSGMAWYNADAFPQWRGDLLIGALVDEEVRRVDLEDGKVVGEESLFGELEARIRDVRVGLDGQLYLLTDGEDGKLIRVTPAAP